MTEAEWPTSRDPEAMLKAASEFFRTARPHGQRTVRKRAFFGAACCRLVWPLIKTDPRCLRGVEFLETQFDVEFGADEFDEIWGDMKNAAEHPEDETPLFQSLAANLVCDAEDPGWVTRYLLRSFKDWGDVRERAGQIADILRCVAGNPFRPDAFDPTWRTSTVLALARGIYDDRAFDRLPILADALQEAGCDDDDLLAHCRGPGPHVRGCRAVDRCLGLE